MGNSLNAGKWKAILNNDLQYHIKPLPGYNLEKFPFVVGLNGDRTELLLANLRTEVVVPLTCIKKLANFDCITDISIMYKEKSKEAKDEKIAIMSSVVKKAEVAIDVNSLTEIKIFFSTHYYKEEWKGTFYSNYITLDADLIQHLLHGSGNVPTSKHAVKQLLRENDKYIEQIKVLEGEVQEQIE